MVVRWPHSLCPAVSSSAVSAAASSPRNAVRRGDKAQHLLRARHPPWPPTPIDIAASIGRMGPGSNRVVLGQSSRSAIASRRASRSEARLRKARAKIFSPCALSRRWTTLASAGDGVRSRRPAFSARDTSSVTLLGRAAGDRRARSPSFAPWSGAPLICRRSRYHAGVIPQSRATTSVRCWKRRSATRNSATRAPRRQSVRLPVGRHGPPIVKRLRRVCAGVRVRRRNRVVLRPAHLDRPCRSRSRSSAISAGSRRGPVRGGTSSPRPTPSPRCAGATSSAHTRPASGRTRCCPAAGRPAAALHRAAPSRRVLVPDARLQLAGRDDLRLGSRVAAAGVGAVRRDPPGAGVLPDLPGIDWLWVFHNPRAAAGILFVLLVVATILAITGSKDHRTGPVRQGLSILREPRRYLRQVWRGRRSTGRSAWRRSTSPFGPSGCPLTCTVSSSSRSRRRCRRRCRSRPPARTEQALLVYMFAGTAPASDVLSFSVGLKIVVIAVNLTLGTIATLATLRSFPWQVDVDEEATERA